MKRVGDTAKDYWAKIKSLPPDEGEAQAIKEKQANVDAVTAKPTPEPEHTGSEPMPQSQYGTRGGEKRLDWAMKPGAPVYDNGGDVAMAGFRKMAPSLDEEDPHLKEEQVTPYTGGKPQRPQPKEKEFNGGSVGGVQDTALATPMYAPGQAPAMAAPTVAMPVNKFPMDNGGDVKNINDGQHQVAILQTGERVLDRDEAARYRQMHGSKMPTMHESMDVNTGKPSSSLPELTPAIKPTPTAPLYDQGGIVGGSNLRSMRAPLYDMGGDVENEDEGTGKKRTEEEQGAPTIMPTEASAKTARPYAEVEAEQKKAAEAKVNGDRGAQVAPAPTQESVPEQLPTATHEERVAIKHDEQDAMGKGVQGLTQLGMAKIHAKQLGINEEPSTEGITAPKEFARQDATPKLGIPKMGEATPEATPAAPAAGPAAPAAAPTTTSERSPDFKIRLKQLELDHANALAERTPEGKVKADYIQEQINDLHKNNPWGTAGNHPGFMGKLGHIASKFGNIAGDVFAPGTMELIPGTDLNKRVQEAGLQKQTQADVQEATAREAEENKATPGAVGTLKEATQGGMIDPLHPELGPQQALYNDKTGKVEYKGQMPPKEGAANALATSAELADVNTRIKNNPSLSTAQQEQLQFPANYKPTVADVKERLANVKDIEDAARQGKQDEFNNGIRKLTEENANLMVKAHLQEMQDKREAAEAKAAQNADVAQAGLYAQEEYRDAMKEWYKSGKAGIDGKDSALITEIVNKERSGQGAFGASTGGAVVGSLFGPEGTAIGAGVGALTGLFAGPINGYLDTLKKEGISDEGYKAMQAYFNTLPARFAYEVGVQGVSATALRSSQLIQKVLNTVPPPNTPQDVFDDNFAQYYTPMKRLTEGKSKLTAPKGYVPPSKDEFYPPKAKPAVKPPVKKPVETGNGYSPNNPFAPKQ